LRNYKILVVLVCLIMSSAYTADDYSKPIPIKKKTNWEHFIDAVIEVESGGDDSAYNKRERAVGCLQIRPIAVREVNRLLEVSGVDGKYTLDDRYDRVRSIEMFMIMAEQVDCCENLSEDEFFEIVARRWNGGYRGARKKSTIKYWEKVKVKYYEKQINYNR
jgi:hypothetical protein